MCAHTVAVAYKVGKLEEFVASYKVPIGQMVQAGIRPRTIRDERQWSGRENESEQC